MPFDPADIDAVLLTHAHIDHSGYLPRLTRQGLKAPIYCTKATAEVAPILLEDAARLQEEDAEYANKKGFSKHHPALPLYTEADARNAIKRIEAVPVGREFGIGDCLVRFHDAGHILGAAFIEITCPSEEGQHRIVFSGDVGRPHDALHIAPDPLPICDTLVIESTYGDRKHGRERMIDQIKTEFERTFRRHGTVLIPAFAVARAQMVLLLLGRLMDEGSLPRVPIHIDSPMAVDVTSIYRRHAGSPTLDVERQELYPPGVTFHRTTEESMRLNGLKGPRIIISASGMLTGGRVLHHLKRLLTRPENLVVLAGYQAAGTRGRALLEGAQTLRMHGIDVPVHARLLHIEELSAHADADELEQWVRTAPEAPLTAFLVHGEPEALTAFSKRLSHLDVTTIVPALNETYALSGVSTWIRQAPRPNGTRTRGRSAPETGTGLAYSESEQSHRP